MVKLLDRVKQAVSGTASSTTLGAAAEGFRTFNTAGAATNDVCRYAIEDDNGAFEIGTIVINSATTGTRTVELSSNSNNALTLTGNAVIFATLSAADLSGNAAPIWTTTPPSTLDLNSDGSTAVTLAGVAIDEFPVHYSWDGFSGTTVYDADSLPPQLSSAPTFSGGTASLIGSSTSSNAGSFNFRLKASDGVKTATAITTVNLTFRSPYTTGLLGWYDADDYTSGASTWSDKSGNSGPTMAVNTSNITYVASSTGGLPTVQIAGAHAISTSTSFGTGATCVIISSDTETRVYQWRLFSPSPSTTSSFLYYVNAGGAYSGTNDVFTGPNFGLGENTTSSKVYVDKALKVVGSSPTGYTTSQFYADIFGPELHSIALTDMDLSSGWSFGGEAGRYPRMKVRAILFYDHEPTAANIAKTHDYYKDDYSSDTDMAP